VKEASRQVVVENELESKDVAKEGFEMKITKQRCCESGLRDDHKAKTSRMRASR
jgi:hypothetical protein